ncbi:hypothetical protein [Micromonospora sp. RTGN7]|uniref:hypothetical protein n=1 Tax=Micromonospora sp. RTGN7 TaxID=3016526 RepID=UPI0029FF2030|nr:hypothetical protein [Micromonospora sp. RTGN7]
MTTAERYLTVALAVAVVVAIAAVALGRMDALDADQLAGERDDLRRDLTAARRELLDAHRREGPLRAELSALRRADTAQAALTPDADLLPALDIHTLRQVWACSPADFNTPGDAR